MREFTYVSLPSRVVFGQGSSARIADEVQRLNLERVVVLSTPGQKALAETIAARLGPLAAGIHAGAVMHVPREAADAAVEQVRALNADGLVAVGGGSTIGLGKAIALQTGLPQIALPTTYAGSEMTPIWGLTTAGVKSTGRDLRVLPLTVIYDPALSAELPQRIAATSGMNAIAHCVEALYSADANPIISIMAEEGIRALSHGLPLIMQNPKDQEAREQALYGAWLAGCVLGMAGMALHHKLCHTLGGSFNLPHADVHTVVLPFVTAFNSEAAPDAMAAIARALAADSAAGGLYDLVVALKVPHSLADLGMKSGDLDKAADLATRNAYYNPREVSRENVRELLQAAYEGRRPQ